MIFVAVSAYAAIGDGVSGPVVGLGGGGIVADGPYELVSEIHSAT